MKLLLLMPLLMMTVMTWAEEGEAFHKELRSRHPSWYDDERDDWIDMRHTVLILDEEQTGDQRHSGPDAVAEGEAEGKPDRKAAEEEAERDSRRKPIRMSGSFGLSTVVNSLLIGILVGFLGLLIYVGIRQWLQRRKKEEVKPQSSPRTVVLAQAAKALPMDLGERSDDPAADLAAARRRGDWSAVAVWAYALALIRLDEAGLIRLRRGMTNRRYCRQLRKGPLTGRLDGLAQACELVVFGALPVMQDRAEAVCGDLELIERHCRKQEQA